MLENTVERTILLAAVGLWFAHGWYLNTKLARVHSKLDRLLENFGGLREYLYEIDPQFDDERRSTEAFHDNESLFAGMSDVELLRKKKAEGKRTLNMPFVE